MQEARRSATARSPKETAELVGSKRTEESVPEERRFKPCVKLKIQPRLQGDMSTNSSVDNCLTPSEDTYQVFSWMMAGEFILGLPLNLSVLFVFIFRFKFWKNNSVFLFNIVVADFLLVVSLPFKIHHYQNNLRHSNNNVVCKTMHFMLFLNRGASIAFLVTLSLDRYFSVVHLGRKNCVRMFKKSPQISLVIWLLLVPLTIPTMVNTFDCCNSHGRRVETYMHDVTDTFREIFFFTQIIIPFFILVYCTVRIVNRLKKKTVGENTKLRKATFAVMSVVVVFSVCFLPCMLARAVLLGVRLSNWEDTELLVVQVYDGLMVLSFADCLLDPLVYCFCHSGFKNAYINTFCPKALQKGPLKPDSSVGSPTALSNTGNSAAKTISLPILVK